MDVCRSKLCILKKNIYIYCPSVFQAQCQGDNCYCCVPYNMTRTINRSLLIFTVRVNTSACVPTGVRRSFVPGFMRHDFEFIEKFTYIQVFLIIFLCQKVVIRDDIKVQ